MKTGIATLSKSHTSISSATQHLYESLDSAYNELPSTDELQQDAAIVSAKLAAASRDSERLLHIAYTEEVERMVKLIEGGADIEDIISQSSSEDVQKAQTTIPKVDVKVELECAGRLDRLVLLQSQEAGLDAVRYRAFLYGFLLIVLLSDS